MELDILYFAGVRDAIGLDGETLTVPVEVATLGDLLDWLSTQSEGHARALNDRGRLRAAIDQRFVSPADSLAGAREVAIFPPVTGG